MSRRASLRLTPSLERDKLPASSGDSQSGGGWTSIMLPHFGQASIRPTAAVSRTARRASQVAHLIENSGSTICFSTDRVPRVLAELPAHRLTTDRRARLLPDVS